MSHSQLEVQKHVVLSSELTVMRDTLPLEEETFLKLRPVSVTHIKYYYFFFLLKMRHRRPHIFLQCELFLA